MSKASLLVIIFFTCLTIVLVSFSIKIWSESSPQSSTPVASPSATQKPASTIPNNPEPYPFNPKSPNVRSVQIIYQFVGKLQRINKTANGIELFTNIDDRAVPKFILNKDTKIVVSENGQEKNATSDDLAVQQRLALTSVYKYQTKQWVLNKVSIVKTSSPSASVKK